MTTNQEDNLDKVKIKAEDIEDNAEDYILIRIPKSINPNDFNGLKIKLNKRQKSIGSTDLIYDFLPADQYPILSVDNIQDNNGELKINNNYSLRGCLHFYKIPNIPDERIPLKAFDPNESIEDIINRKRPNDTSNKPTRNKNKRIKIE